jgi:hypothetical protein
MFTMAELRLLIEGLATVSAEYGERPERAALEARLREALERLRAEAGR